MFDIFNRKKVKDLEKRIDVLLTDLGCYISENASLEEELELLKRKIKKYESGDSVEYCKKREADVKSFVENCHTNTRATK